MTIYEIIAANQSLLKVLKENAVNATDVENLDLYREFKAMKKKQHKTVYCVAVLADKYGMSHRTVYNIVKHFRTEVTL